MARFVKLTRAHGDQQPVHVNVDRLVGLFRAQGATTLVDSSDSPWRVRETPEEILALIKEA